MAPKARGDTMRDRARHARSQADNERVKAAVRDAHEVVHLRAAAVHEQSADAQERTAEMMDRDDARPLTP